MKIKSIFSLRKWVGLFCEQKIARKISDKTYLKLKYYSSMGKKLNLENPETFNEKLQWLKLYDRKPEYTVMVDKFASKKYVADKIGEEYVVPLLGGPWYSFDEIDFDSLPEQFVLKTNHDCGGVVICKDKNSFDKEKAKPFLEWHMKREYFWHGREWPYKGVKPCIFAEAYMEEVAGDLPDYKFFCFNGVPKLLMIEKNRYKGRNGHTVDFFDMNFTHMDITVDGYPNCSDSIEKPKEFDKMVSFATSLSNNIPQLRVDFYNANNQIYLGELTFFHASGMFEIEPSFWAKTMGDWIKLSTKTEEES